MGIEYDGAYEDGITGGGEGGACVGGKGATLSTSESAEIDMGAMGRGGTAFARGGAVNE
jgi:hypothetical protein